MENPTHEILSCVLSVAGSDSGAGAGIQADVRTCTSLGVHCCTAITAVTAQNTQGVQARYDLPTEVVRQQLKSCFEDFVVKVVKTGMLANTTNIRTLIQVLEKYSPAFLVVDPVIMSSSGAQLLEFDALTLLKLELMPHISLFTPNLEEAAYILKCPVATTEEMMKTQCEQLLAMGPKALLLKGGHLNSAELRDYYMDRSKAFAISHSRLHSPNTHGTGCTLASAISAYLVKGERMETAVQSGINYLQTILKQSVGTCYGHGKGPMSHWYWQDQDRL